ncbi:MAG: hypothetical protein AAFV19_21865 [Pseudomonadota bacterium]
MTRREDTAIEDLITLDDGDQGFARADTFIIDLYGNDTLEAADTLDIIAIEDGDVADGGSDNSKPPLTAGGYFNDINRDFDESKPAEAPDIIVIEDDDASADVVYGSSNSCIHRIGYSNDTITGDEDGPIDIITTGEIETDYDDLELLDLTIGEDKDAHASYGGTNTCDPYAGDNTCEPPEDLKSNDNPHTDWIDLL